jgi:Mn2+/Fe2+ NRAMP family transporter
MGKSLEEVNEVSTLDKKSALENISLFGPAYLISVGYMDRKLGD